MKFASQGVRQMASLPLAEDGQILRPGESFIRHNTPSTSDGDIVFIAQGTIGVVHKSDGDVTISVISDDCKAARRAIAAFAIKGAKIYSQKDVWDEAKSIANERGVKLLATGMLSGERNMSLAQMRNAALKIFERN